MKCSTDFCEQRQTICAHSGILVIDHDRFEESVHRTTQFGKFGHSCGEILGLQRIFNGGLDIGQGFREGFFLGWPLGDEGVIDGEISRQIALFLLGLEDVRGALVAREQVCAVFGIQECAKRLDAARDEHKIILTESEHGVDEIMTLTFVSEVLFKTVCEEGKEVAS